MAETEATDDAARIDPLVELGARRQWRREARQQREHDQVRVRKQGALTLREGSLAVNR